MTRGSRAGCASGSGGAWAPWKNCWARSRPAAHIASARSPPLRTYAWCRSAPARGALELFWPIIRASRASNRTAVPCRPLSARRLHSNRTRLVEAGSGHGARMKNYIRYPRVEGVASRQAHADLPKGSYEREMGKEGFFGPASFFYHRHPPTGWINFEGPLRPHAFDLTKLGR